MEGQFNREFVEQVEYLRGKRIVRKDTDIAARTGYDKTTISNYLAGRVRASKPFMKRFNEVYGEDLADMDENKVVNLENNTDSRNFVTHLQNELKYQKEIYRELLDLYRELSQSFRMLSGMGDAPAVKKPLPKPNI